MLSTFPLLLAMLFGSAAHALKVDHSDSYVRFISVKKGSVAEIGGFSRFAGDIDTEGKFTLSVDLTSVDTAIEIRDQRLRNEFFEVDEFPSSKVTGKVNLAALGELKAGEMTSVPVEATVHLHGAEQQVKAELAVTRMGDGRLRVSTVDPVMLSLAELGLIEGVQMLQQLAGLPSINQVVPVYFSLMLSDTD